jgi:hypothetical protein
MARIEQSQALERGVERQVVLQVGPLVGIDLRPSRLFFWYGPDRSAGERIVSLDAAPRVLRQGRPRRYVHLPGVEVSYLGNPMVTMVLSGRSWYRRLRGSI